MAGKTKAALAARVAELEAALAATRVPGVIVSLSLNHTTLETCVLLRLGEASCYLTHTTGMVVRQACTQLVQVLGEQITRGLAVDAQIARLRAEDLDDAAILAQVLQAWQQEDTP